MARKRRHKPGDLTQLRRVLWDTILKVEALEDEPDCPADRLLRCAHALSQLSATYTRLIETADLAKRIEAIEARLGDREGGPS